MLQNNFIAHFAKFLALEDIYYNNGEALCNLGHCIALGLFNIAHHSLVDDTHLRTFTDFLQPPANFLIFGVKVGNGIQ